MSERMDRWQEMAERNIGPVTAQLANLYERLEKADERHKEMALENQELRRALDAIIIRCEEGDPESDWLPTIARIARAILEKGKPTLPEEKE